MCSVVVVAVVVVVVVFLVVVVAVVVVVVVVVEVRVVKLVKSVKLVKLVNQCLLFRHLHVKKGSKPSVFDTFDFEMCFAPQRRALFRHFFDI